MISYWNFFNQYTYVVQILVIFLLVVISIFVIRRIIERLNNEGGNSTSPRKVTVNVRYPSRRRRRR